MELELAVIIACVVCPIWCLVNSLNNGDKANKYALDLQADRTTKLAEELGYTVCYHFGEVPQTIFKSVLEVKKIEKIRKVKK